MKEKTIYIFGGRERCQKLSKTTFAVLVPQMLSPHPLVSLSADLLGREVSDPMEHITLRIWILNLICFHHNLCSGGYNLNVPDTQHHMALDYPCILSWFPVR